jgi:hypothetical protein
LPRDRRGMRGRVRPLNFQHIYWKLALMRNAIRRRAKAAFLFAFLAVVISPDTTLAQSGSMGGSIGNDEKSLSGSREAPRSQETEQPARKNKPAAEEPRRNASRSGGGGAGNFDGAWVVVGIGTTCSGSSTTAVVVSSGRIIGQGVSGHVSASGSASAVGNSNGIIINSVGRLSGRSGAGSFRQSDGCVGRWTASKQ